MKVSLAGEPIPTYKISAKVEFNITLISTQNYATLILSILIENVLLANHNALNIGSIRCSYLQLK